MIVLISLIEAVLLLSGAGSPEELAESEMERYEELANHRVCINIAGPARLRSCGLFSEYQVASLEDYMSRSGDILSATELGTVPGFTPELSQALALFVSFESYSNAGSRHSKRVRQTAMIRDVAKGESQTIAGKYHLQYGERAELYLSCKDEVTGSLTVYGRRPWKMVLGDFNTRFGQGLLAWSGFSLSGFSTVSSFSRNASGISGTGSFSASGRGIGVGYSGRFWNGSAAVNVEGAVLMSASCLGGSGSVGINAVLEADCRGVSVDWKKNYGHLNLFGEAAFAEAPAVLAGAKWDPAYKVCAAILLRYYSPEYASSSAGAARSASKVKDEAGIAAGVQARWFSATLDLALHPERITGRKNNYEQFKSVLSASPEFRKGAWTFSPVLKWTERMQLSPDGDAFRADWRHDLRCDLKAARGGLLGTVRLNGVQVSGKRPGGLAYLEIGYRTASDTARLQWSAFARGTICETDGWASRIYAYERDVPGSFSVPAWYGSKYGLALVGSMTYNRKKTRHRLNLRLSRNEFKLQYQLCITMHSSK